MEEKILSAIIASARTYGTYFLKNYISMLNRALYKTSVRMMLAFRKKNTFNFAGLIDNFDNFDDKVFRLLRQHIQCHKHSCSKRKYFIKSIKKWPEIHFEFQHYQFS